MAIEKAITTHGVTHSGAYWKVVQVNLNMPTQTGKVIFDCYHSSSQKDIPANVLTQKDYSINTDNYGSYFDPDVVKASGLDHVNRAYVFAKNTNDTIKSSYFLSGAKWIDNTGSVVTKENAHESFFTGGSSV